MKLHIAICTGLMLSGAVVYAGKPLVAEAPMNEAGTASCVSISTSAWTAVPASATSGRIGLYVTATATNTANMNGIIGASAPTNAITEAPLLIKPGVTQYHGLSDAALLYLRSLHTAAETVCVQEVKQ